MLLSILTVNIGAASRERADIMLRWLADRSEDVLILTETSGGVGTTYLLNEFRRAGFTVVHTPSLSGDRGTAIVSRVDWVADAGADFGSVSIPGRIATVRLRTRPEIGLLGVYVPSRDRSLEKTAKKEEFIASLITAIDALPIELRGSLVIGGDYNTIGRTHQPRHVGFLPFEFGLLDSLERQEFIDAYQHCSPGRQVYSWIGRTGNGYRYDYFHVGKALARRIRGCEYLQETREKRLTDHAAVTLTLELETVQRLEISNPTESNTFSLF